MSDSGATPPMTPGRRWAPIVAVVTSFVMVFLVLPNPLRIPQNNPSASPEYAPVPGREQSASNANFGETNVADSSGIGSGGEGDGGVGVPPPPPPPQYKPRQKNCVGNPPRQTEDPLSPPCVPFWDHDNGGSTWNGVTKDEIKVVLYNDLGLDGDLNKPWRPSDEAPDHQSDYQTSYLVRTIKAQLRYFQKRYQTYGRTVKLYAQKSQSRLSTTCPQRRGDASRTWTEHSPFASVHFGDGGQCYMEELATEYKVPSFGLNSDVKRGRYERHRPYIWGFFPDQESEAAWSASFVCKKLAGRPAKFAYGEDLKAKQRTFGMIYPRVSDRGPESAELAQLFIKYVKAECGLDLTKPPHKVKTIINSGAQDAGAYMSEFKRDGITTVICYCVPVQTELTVPTYQNTATSLDYYPEWYWDHASRMFRAIWNQTYGDKSGRQRGFGVSQHWRQPAFREQYHYQAYLQEEPGTVPNTRFNFDIYHLFLNLFQAIQAAGPTLTPDSVEKGMFTFNYLQRNNPYVPTGGYGAYGPDAIGTYTFIDTGMGWWWDPEGTPPGGTTGEGCLRVIREGLRFYPGEWPAGDDDLFRRSGDPCTQDDTELTDPKPGDF